MKYAYLINLVSFSSAKINRENVVKFSHKQNRQISTFNRVACCRSMALER